MSYKIKFVIANYFSDKHTLELVKQIESIEKFDNTVNLNIYDNSRTLNDNFDLGEIKYYLPNRNLGLGPIWKLGWNEAIKDCDDFLILSNNDITLPQDFFRKIKAISSSDNSIYGPVILNPSGQVWSAGGSISPFLGRIRHNNKLLDVDLKNTQKKVEHLSGCFLIIPRAVLLNSRLVSSDFFFRGEEWYLNWQAGKRKIKRIVLTGLNVTHIENSSHDRFSLEHIYYAVRAKMLYGKKTTGNNFFLWGKIYFLYLFFYNAFFYNRNSNSSIIDVYRVIFSAYNKGLSSKVIREHHVKEIFK